MISIGWLLYGLILVSTTDAGYQATGVSHSGAYSEERINLAGNFKVLSALIIINLLVCL
jgi:hypothetical protein